MTRLPLVSSASGPCRPLRAALAAAWALAAGACDSPLDQVAPAARIGAVAESTKPGAAIRRLRELAHTAGSRPASGANGWLFLPFELLSLDDSHVLEADTEAERAQALRTMPISKIAEFRGELARRKIELIVVPVPQKVAIYPEQAIPGVVSGSTRIDPTTVATLDSMRRDGIEYVDLDRHFREAKDGVADDPLYVPSDTHWSSRGCAVAARAIADKITALFPDLAAPPGRPGDPLAPVLLPIHGDLERLMQRETAGPASEKMYFHRAVEVPGNEAVSAGPIVLLGDSHLLVWRGERAGLNDHLSARLLRPIPQIGVQVGGPQASRQALGRRPEILDEARVVVWLFAARFLVTDDSWNRLVAR